MPTTPASPATPSPAITLSETDRSHLQTVVHRGHIIASTRAQVLLKLAEAWSEAQLYAAFDSTEGLLGFAWEIGAAYVMCGRPPP